MAGRMSRLIACIILDLWLGRSVLALEAGKYYHIISELEKGDNLTFVR